MRALGVAVTSSVLRTSLVGGEARHATVLVHLHEVEGTVQAARKRRHVDVEGELLVLEVEHLVGGVVVGEEVHAGTDIRSGRSLGHKLHRERVPAGGDTVGA